MMHAWTRQCVPLGLVALAAAGCDGGTDPADVWDDFDPVGVAASTSDLGSPSAASTDASIAVLDAMAQLGFAGLDPAPGDLAIREIPAQIRTRTFPAAVAPALRPLVEIPTELQGRTFVFDPEAGTWTVAEDRTGAPANGFRIVYYAINSSGDYILPLQERGHIDLTDEDTETMSRLGITIRRTADGPATLADFVQGYGESETTAAHVLRYTSDGYFSDGVRRVDIGFAAVDSLDNITDRWHSSLSMLFEGEETSYRWVSDARETASGYVETLLVTVLQGDVSTVLALEFTGDSDTAGDAGGSLSHRGVVLAHIGFVGNTMVFTRPGGGSFTQQEQQRLTELVTTMVLSAFLILGGMPILVL